MNQFTIAAIILLLGGISLFSRIGFSYWGHFRIIGATSDRNPYNTWSIERKLQLKLLKS